MGKKWAEIVAKAWKDKQFKAKLLSNPEQVLKDHGLSCPPNTTYKIVGARENEMCLILPPKPAGDLSETDLRKIAAANQCNDPPSKCAG
jgi:hypothetical protein